MGCSGSKVDDLPVVSLCRERTRFIEEAVQQRYLLSAAHLSYIRSLREVGAALEAFVNVDHVSAMASPVLTLPAHRKSDPVPLPKPKSPPASPPQSGGAGSQGGSNSGHLQFDSDDDDSVSDDHHIHSDSPPPAAMFHEPAMMDGYSGYPPPYAVMNQYFMRSRPMQPVTYEERPQSPAKVNQYFMPSTPVQLVAYDERPESSEKANHYFMRSMPMRSVAYEERQQSPEKVNQYFMRSRPMQSVAYEGLPQSPEKVQWGQSYPYYSSNFGFPGFFGGAGGTSSSSPTKPPPPAYSAAGPSSSSYPYEQNRPPPPPPPPPPKSSTWDFLNPFDSYEGFYTSYTPKRYSDGGSRDSREVREEEGIPDLEEDSQSEVVKEVHGEQKFSDGFMGHPGWYHQKNVQFQAEDSVLQDEEKGGGEQAVYQGKSTAVSEYGEDDGTELVDKNVIENDKPVERSNATEFPRSYDAFEAVKHIKVQFVKAAESGNEVSVILEVGKLPYRHKNAVRKASVRMLGAIAPPMMLSSQPSSSKTRTAQLPSSVEPSTGLLDFEDVTWLRTRKLSTTLEKLYMWEKKLCEEVRAEEKLRVVQERKRRQLRKMNERGSEALKVEATQTLIRNLSTKIRITIHFVDSVSTKINKLRDEELWPQIAELLQGLVTMWKTMLECHQNQCRIISEAKNMDYIVDGVISSESHMRATVHLELELLNWISSFYVWVATQKGYIRALNEWLLKCLLQEPEVTPDGVVPFSPGRVGAPPIFVMCNRWWQAIQVISEKEVIEAMRTFSILVFQLWQRHNAEQRRRLASAHSPKDMERGFKALQKDEQKIQKAWDALNKKLFLVPGESGPSLTKQVVQQSQAATLGGLKAGLKQIFDAMVRFAESSLKVYEELDLHSEVDRITREREKVS